MRPSSSFLLSAVLTMASAAPLPAATTTISGRVVWVADGDTFRLESGERIRIAGVDAAETQVRQAKCKAELARGAAAKARLTEMITGRTVGFERVGRSYNRTVANVWLDGRDLAAELVRLDVARPWPRGRPRPVWCD